MLIENICDIFFNFFFGFLNEIPVMQWEVSFSSIDPFITFLDFAAYFLPMKTVIAMLGIIIAEENIKIGISMFKLIWKFIPIVGA